MESKIPTTENSITVCSGYFFNFFFWSCGNHDNYGSTLSESYIYPHLEQIRKYVFLLVEHAVQMWKAKWIRRDRKKLNNKNKQKKN